MRSIRTIPIATILLCAVACGPSERPKFHIKKASDYEPIVTPAPPPTASSTQPATASVAPPGSEMTIVEVGGFKGACDHSFSSINDEDLVALANPTGLRSYRLAGIAITPGIRAEAHAQLRSWLLGEAIGVELDSAGGGSQPAAYLYRCSSATMVNAELVRSGLAVVSDAPSMHRDALGKASMEALSARRGVWATKGK